ncbi:serine/threonine-protein kinase [Myxococcus sp. RHSTA-1-4]|uniref:serine/threonine-protein kinase n=1 Tax=Myxococcus sp. RHSTA-1-4 TaxID=2874601 RepID=UPI001CBE8C27|nr:serine/threonine-protein kinase [Myxococcus sp. RHSTA-1-4]MBZ4418615.1 protein kinase [Myxococcus sp. RHSTA-1-4]
MDCLTESQLADLASGDASPEARHDIDVHLDGCAACRAQVAIYLEAGEPRTEPFNWGEQPTDVLTERRTPSQGTFLPRGTRLGRYVVQEVLGQGGMGVVYAAYDPQLDRQICIKLLRATGKAASEELLREAQAAARPSHPHVVTVHDIGVEGERVFLTMERVEGTTLRGWLKERPRGVEEILSLFEQAGQGLAAAHAVGLVHRDFKPENVLVDRNGVARVTDFGLARLLSSGAPPSPHEPAPEAPAVNTARGEMTLRLASRVEGTPGYVAPELLRREPASVRSDVYSFCVSLDEALKEQPRASIPAGVHAVIARGLAEHPDARYGSMGDLLADLARARSARPPKRRFAMGAAALLLLIAGSALAWRLWHGPARRGTAERPTLAVLALDNRARAPEQAWLGTVLGEALTAELSAGAGFRLVSPQMVADLRLPVTPSTETLLRLQVATGAELALSGGFRVTERDSGELLQVELVLHDAASGAELARVSESGASVGEVLELARRAGKALREELKLKALTESEAREARDALPRGAEAARLYAEGLAAQRRQAVQEAHELFSRAAEAEPSHPMIHAALARVSSVLGYSSEARASAERAIQLSGGLSREARLALQGEVLSIAKAYPEAVKTFSALWTFYPDNLDYGLSLARAQTEAGQPRDALATLERLRQLPPPANQDPRIGLQEASTRQDMGDFRGQLEATRRGEAHARPLGDTRVLAELLYFQAWALFQLGQLDDARASHHQGLETCERLQLDGCLARGADMLGAMDFQQGRLDESAESHRTAVALQRKIGNVRGEEQALHNLANTLRRKGELTEALQILERLVEASARRSAPNDEMRARGSLANVLVALGELPAAETQLEKALTLARKTGERPGLTATLINLGNVHHGRGELARAEERLVEGLRLCREAGLDVCGAYALAGLGGVYRDRGDVPRARQHLEEALVLFHEAQRPGDVNNARLMLARLALDERKPAVAEALAREGQQSFTEQKAPEALAEAHMVLGQSLLARKDLVGARAELDKARAVAQSDLLRHQLTVVEAQLWTASGEPSRALGAFREALPFFEEKGHVLRGLEARLAQARAQVAAGRTADGTELLRVVDREAKARGAGRIERLARAPGR